MFYWFFFLLCLVNAQAGSVSLINDTPFTLSAEILSATGTHLAKETLKPGQNLNTNLDPTEFNAPGDSQRSQTPYSVIWLCDSGTLYSYCSSVFPGSLVQASQCSGNLYCQPKKDDKSK